MSVNHTIIRTNNRTIHDLTNPKKHSDINPNGISIIKKFNVSTFLNVLTLKHFNSMFEAIKDVTIDATIIEINKEIVLVAVTLFIHPISESNLL